MQESYRCTNPDAINVLEGEGVVLGHESQDVVGSLQNFGVSGCSKDLLQDFVLLEPSHQKAKCRSDASRYIAILSINPFRLFWKCWSVCWGRYSGSHDGVCFEVFAVSVSHHVDGVVDCLDSVYALV